jgi:hypothetical protein
MAKAKPAAKKAPAAKATKAIIKDKPVPKKAAAAKGKKDVLALPEAVPALSRNTSKASMKDPVAPVKAPALSRSASKASKILDLCLLLDCTRSMNTWIERSKDTLKEIIDNVRADNPDLDVRVCFVGYRDIESLPRFSIHEFTSDLEKIKKYISGVNTVSGGYNDDFPEDVQGGFHEALKRDWKANSIKMAFHIFDAPGHGKDICPDYRDSYPAGSPDGHKIQD